VYRIDKPRFGGAFLLRPERLPLVALPRATVATSLIDRQTGGTSDVGQAD
jgi:hypothetical protein